MNRAEAIFARMKRPLIMGFLDRAWKRSAETAAAERSSVASRTKLCRPQSADFVGNVSTHHGEVEEIT